MLLYNLAETSCIVNMSCSVSNFEDSVRAMVSLLMGTIIILSHYRFIFVDMIVFRSVTSSKTYSIISLLKT